MLAALAGGGAASAEPAGARAEVPIKEVVLSDGMRRYTVPIAVGGASIEAGLDSGSTGLRILPGALKPGDAERTSTPTRYGYGSGVELRGVVARATLRIGEAAGPTKLQQVEEVGCLPRFPRCPATRVSQGDYGIQGDGLKGEGFKAILGVGMADADVDSPLRAIGARRWIIELPLPGSGRPGRLILNPTEEETRGYMAFRTDPGLGQALRGMHDAIPACLENVATKQALCGPALLDTGAPGIEILNPTGAVWPNGTTVTLAFFNGTKPQTAATFEIGRREYASRLVFQPEPPVGRVRLRTGLAAYFAYSVLYDPEAGEIGLKPRPDTKMVVQSARAGD